MQAYASAAQCARACVCCATLSLSLSLPLSFSKNLLPCEERPPSRADQVANKLWELKGNIARMGQQAGATTIC